MGIEAGCQERVERIFQFIAQQSISSLEHRGRLRLIQIPEEKWEALKKQEGMEEVNNGLEE